MNIIIWKINDFSIKKSRFLDKSKKFDTIECVVIQMRHTRSCLTLATEWELSLRNLNLQLRLYSASS